MKDHFTGQAKVNVARLFEQHKRIMITFHRSHAARYGGANGGTRRAFNLRDWPLLAPLPIVPDYRFSNN